MGRLRANRALLMSMIDQGDALAPSVTGFAATTPCIGNSISVTTFTASEAGVNYLITTSLTPPLPGAAGWSASAPTTFDATADGSCTLYPWVKDVAGNVSAVYGAPVAVEVYETPAYTNTGGTGDRQAIITASTNIAGSGPSTYQQMVNGNTAEGTSYYNAGVALAGKEVSKFIFPNKVIITEVKFWSSNGGQSSGHIQGQGSNNGADWTNIGGQSELLNLNPQTITTLSANGAGYTQYRFLGVDGAIITGGLYNREWQFKIGNLRP